MFVLVGSKFGAGVFPGISNANSRKLRPFRGRFSICRELTTPSTTDETVFTSSVGSLSSTFIVVSAFCTLKRIGKLDCWPT